MNKLDYIVLWSFIPVVVFGALFDAFYIENATWLGYIGICLIEYLIFLAGYLLGQKIKENKEK